MIDINSWWNSLDHNWKKILLVNLDFNDRFSDHKFVENEITLHGSYDAYFKHFKVGIRSRLDAFDSSEKELLRIQNITRLIVRYPKLNNFEMIANLEKVIYLTLTGSLTTNLKEIKSLHNLEYLNLNCGSLEGFYSSLSFPKLKVLKLVYCYKLKNIEYVEEFKNLNTVDITFLGDTIDISPLIKLKNLKQIFIHRNQIYFHNDWIKPANDEKIEKRKNLSRSNYNAFFIYSDNFELIQTNYTDWMIKRKNILQLP